MKTLNTKQQDLLSSIKIHSVQGSRRNILPGEVQTAKALERKELITLDYIETGNRKFYEATLVDPRRKAVETIQGFMAELKAACRDLEGASDPNTLLDHMGTVKDNGRIETLRRALQERALELFDLLNEQKKV